MRYFETPHLCWKGDIKSTMIICIRFQAGVVGLVPCEFSKIVPLYLANNNLVVYFIADHSKNNGASSTVGQ